MKVILLRDVAKIGKRYEIVDVPDGFALNKLIPKGDAQQASSENVKRVNNMRAKNQMSKADELLALKVVAATFTTEPLSIEAQANEQGHLFKAVHAEDIVSAAKARGVHVAKEQIVISTPIKSTGAHVLELKSQKEVFSITINVVAK
jgi:large subunit ribosomal protein L9